MFLRSLAIAVLFACASFAPGATVPFAEAANHVGKEVTVTGRVSRVSTIQSGMTFVNFGTRGQGPTFTAVARPGFEGSGKLKAFEGKAIEVTGTVELYKGSPQIVLRSLAAITLAGEAPRNDSPAPEPQTRKPPAGPSYETRIFEVPLDKKESRAAGKTLAGDYPETAVVTVAHPADFNPGKDQRVLVVFTDFLTGEEHEKLLKPYLKAAEREDLFVINARGAVIDSRTSMEWYPTMLSAAIRHLSTEYPEIGEWSFYLAGKGDGATYAIAAACALTKGDFQVKGCYLTSLRFSDIDKAIETFRPSRTKIRQIKFFVAHGSGDKLVSEETSLSQTEKLREARISNVRHEINNGSGWPEPKDIETAIQWFGETEQE